jgi:hypothetical protein
MNEKLKEIIRVREAIKNNKHAISIGAHVATRTRLICLAQGTLKRLTKLEVIHNELV